MITNELILNQKQHHRKQTYGYQRAKVGYIRSLGLTTINKIN